jgi:hypothetical protein
MGRDGSVGIATGYGLDGPGIEFIVLVYCGLVIPFCWFGRSFVVVHVENSSHTPDKLRCLLKCSILVARRSSNFGVALLCFLTSVHKKKTQQ